MAAAETWRGADRRLHEFMRALDGRPLEYNTRQELLNPFIVAFGPRDRDWLAMLR